MVYVQCGSECLECIDFRNFALNKNVYIVCGEKRKFHFFAFVIYSVVYVYTTEYVLYTCITQ